MTVWMTRARHGRTWLHAWVTVALALAAGTFIPWLFLAFERDDVEASESPLMLAVARQLTHGPRELYGPFGGDNPLVLIQAPLYYRLAAGCAWPLTRAGLSAEQAARIAGRGLSLIGWVATLVAVFYLATFQAAPQIAGRWAVLLAAALPVYGGLPVEVRAEMLGVAIQTWGVVLLLGELVSARPREPIIVLSFVFVGLAACVIRQVALTPAVSFFLLVSAYRSRRVRLRILLAAFVIDAIIIFGYYGFEVWLTNGQIARSFYEAIRASASIHPASWRTALASMLGLFGKSTGLILLLTAAAAATVSSWRGRRARALTTASVALFGLMPVLAVVPVNPLSVAISRVVVLGLALASACVLAALVTTRVRSRAGIGIEFGYLVYATGELALAAYAFRLSTGNELTHAVQAGIFGSVLAARAVAATLLEPLPLRGTLSVALAAFAVPVFALTDVKQIVSSRRAENASIDHMLQRVGANRAAIFFVDRPGLNRLHGRTELVYDPWLYPIFESIALAEPRSVWLARALESGPVQVVVTDSPSPRIGGVPRTLPQLGFAQQWQFDKWFVWERWDVMAGSGRPPEDVIGLVARRSPGSTRRPD